MMEMADYWLLEKDLVPKLFKVIVPRYENQLGPYTLVHKLPVEYPGNGKKFIVMELKNNQLPPIKSFTNYRDHSNSLTNILIRSMKEDYYKNKN